MIAVSKPVKWLTLSIPILLVPLLLVFWTIISFPQAPQTPVVPTYQGSLASLPNSSRSWAIYPEDFYQGGQYVTFPQGRVSGVLR